MRGNQGLRGRIVAAAIIIGCAGIVAAISACGAGPLSVGPVVNLPQASCGSAVTHGLTENTQMLGAGRNALSCFSKAAQACKAASIEVRIMGVDTGTDDVFIIRPGGQTCQVTEASQDYSANFGGSQSPVRTTPCHRTAVTGDGVTLSCGGQDLLIPSKVSVP